jgi:hypothetical protein
MANNGQHEFFMVFLTLPTRIMICIPGHHNCHVTEISEPRLVTPYICYVYSSLIQGRFNIVRLNE